MNEIILTPNEKKLVLNYREKLKKGTLLKCKKCGYIWIYSGNSKNYVSCPKCMYGSVHVERHRVKE